MSYLDGIKGIIFDMDGVLVDSEPAMYKASLMGLKDYGIEASVEDFKPFVGTGEESFIGNVARLHGGSYSVEMKDHIYAIYCRIVRDEIVLFPGIKDVLTSLKAKGYSLAVASSADRIKVEANIAAADLPTELFDCILDGSMVTKLKPDPEIFLMAAEKMGIDPKEACVVEDAVSGVKGAKAGGMKCLGITSTFAPDVLLGVGADSTASHIKALLEED